MAVRTAVRTWESNAEEYADLDRGNGWAFAVLVACSVEKGNGHGGNGSNQYGSKPNDRNVSSGKVSASRFADRAGTSTPKVLRYLEAWERASRDGLVPPAADLSPGDVRTVNLPEMGFTLYSGTFDSRLSTERQQAIREQAGRDGVGASKPLNIATNPKAMQAVIKADASIAEAARQALRDRADQEYRREWAQNNPVTLSEDVLRAASLATREKAATEASSFSLDKCVLRAMHAIRQVAVCPVSGAEVLNALEELEGFLHQMQEQRVSHPDFISAVEDYVRMESR